MGDTVFFVASKLIWMLIRPDSWLVLGCALTCLGVWRGRGRGMALATLIFALVMAVFPVGDVILARLEGRYPRAPQLPEVTGIIVLGGGEAAAPAARWGGVQVNDAGERFIEAVALARAFPEAKVVFTGGSASLRKIGRYSTAQSGIAEALFLSLGLDKERLILESRSRNTAENAVLTHDLVQPQAGETWVLVTSAFHMPRALRSFERAGWPGLVAWPVDHRSLGVQNWFGWNLAGNLLRFNVAVKELVGLLAYGWSGR